jgi:NAD(P)-dependent dehydrogenase (short-subunit alcohol dehydrogenase family)
MGLKGHAALITGGGRGIGAAIARRFSRAGIRCFLAARTASELERVARETGSQWDLCDVTRPEQVKTLVRKAGPVQILVNNAGIADSAPFLKSDLEMWRQVLDTNLTSAYLLSRAVLPGMVERKYGRIVNIASIAGKRGAPYITAYAASKHALLGFTSSLAMEMADLGITINAVCPGYVDTPMTRATVTRLARVTGRTKREVLVKLMSSAGQSKLLDPAHVAEVALALARPECSHTGAAIDL